MAMSGGIDSAVSAMLLREQGCELIGVTFRTFDSIKDSCIAREKGCCSVESIMEARNLAHKLGFEHHIIDFREPFRKFVIDNFVDEYMHGRTPNPCVLCNSHIKWGLLLDAADQYGCDMIATGHYARIREHSGHWYLANAVDSTKDQTYFLWMLTEDNLKRTVFPLGGYTKQQTRQMAAERGFVELSKKSESQEICFVTNNDYRSFLEQEVPDFNLKCTEGNYVDSEGNVLGKHSGYPFYTIGQRKGLGIALGKPRFVTHIDAENNQVTLGDHDDLLATHLFASKGHITDLEWLKQDPTVQARIRYKTKPINAKIEIENIKPEENIGLNASFSLNFEQPVWGITPGQSVVLYKDEMLVGGGIIR